MELLNHDMDSLSDASQKKSEKIHNIVTKNGTVEKLAVDVKSSVMLSKGRINSVHM
jgi:hypothetical protein